MKKMKINWVVTTILLICLTACDSPRSQRALSSNSAANQFNNGQIPVDFSDRIEDVNGEDETPTGNGPVIPEDAKHCKFSTDGVSGFESNSTHLGAYTLCQSTADKNTFYFQLKTPPISTNGDVNVCFIPQTTISGNSIYVGNSLCGKFTEPKAVKKITFVKYTQYTNALINSVIFLKDTTYYYPVFNKYMLSLDAYKGCMTALVQYNNSTYCQAFKSVGQYVYKEF